MGAFQRDSAGLAKILKSPAVAAMVKRAADQAASAAEATTDLPIEVETYETDRAAASVSISHPAGAATQAKHGTLTRAAAAIGVQVTER